MLHLGIASSAQSLLKAIQGGSADTADLRRMLNKRAGKTTLLWTSGHHGIAGNGEAHPCPKQAAAITDGAPQPVSFAAASALIRLKILLFSKIKRLLTYLRTSWSQPPPPQGVRQSVLHDSRPKMPVLRR